MVSGAVQLMLPRAAKCGRGDRGFTMVELMVTLVVLAVLLGIASPNLATFISNSRTRSTQSELLAALTLARSEATKRGLPVMVAAVSPTTGNEFTGGWIVSVGGEPLRAYPALAGNQRVVTDPHVESAAFNARGFLSPVGGIRFYVCGQNDGRVFRIQLESSGLADVSEVKTCGA